MPVSLWILLSVIFAHPCQHAAADNDACGDITVEQEYLSIGVVDTYKNDYELFRKELDCKDYFGGGYYVDRLYRHGNYSIYTFKRAGTHQITDVLIRYPDKIQYIRGKQYDHVLKYVNEFYEKLNEEENINVSNFKKSRINNVMQEIIAEHEKRFMF